ncbi:Hypothetical Protein RRSL_04752 [Ralstonia solanacearum UW551]|uniref:Uncharacterized protein n=1 Tax=Ralstonia solanacearum (strain UW551) TaxID=342110 RepID=A0AB33VJ58_RALSU|nr:Hypothetical Protein RRSL_04752 [Ralstonia solanacearum UW551]
MAPCASTPRTPLTRPGGQTTDNVDTAPTPNRLIAIPNT